MTDLSSNYAEALELVDANALDRLHEVADLGIATARAGRRELRLVYAPFDHVNERARVVIVGLTPGARQAGDAIDAFRAARRMGRDRETALALAKRTASFSGPMRRNLIAMLDAVKVADLLGIASCASLWEDDDGLAHFTSAVRYPLFVDGTNWSGTPDLLGTPAIRGWFDDYAPPEFRRLPDALFVPLGDAVSRALHHLADSGHVRRGNILSGLPHPSGANAERVACFIGTKPPHLASSRTDGHRLVADRARVAAAVAALATGRAQRTIPG